MRTRVKLFAIEWIFALLAIAGLIAAFQFAIYGDIWYLIAIIAGLLLFYFIARLLIKRFHLKDKQNQRKMKTSQKILITITICEVWGLTTLALAFWGGSWLGTIKEPNLLGLYCATSCGLTIRICHDLFINAPETLAIIAAFLMQFESYAILGLILSMPIPMPKWMTRKSTTTSCDSSN